MIALEKELESLQAGARKAEAVRGDLMVAVAERGPAGRRADGGRGEALHPKSVRAIESSASRRRGARSAGALLHIMGDLNDSNKRLADQRKAMLHILGDYERTAAGWRADEPGHSRRAAAHPPGLARVQPAAGGQPQGDDPHHGRPARDDAGDGAARAGAAGEAGAARPGGQAGDARRADDRRGPRAQQPAEQHRPVRRQRDRPHRARRASTGASVADLEKAMEQVRKATEIIFAPADVRARGARQPRAGRRQRGDRAARCRLQEQLRLREIEVELDLGRTPGRARQPDPARAGLHQPAHERARRAGGRRPQTDPDRRARPAGEVSITVRRHRAGHPARARAAHLRPVLHDQGGRRRHGPRPLDHLRHRQGARGHDLGRDRPARGRPS